MYPKSLLIVAGLAAAGAAVDVTAPGPSADATDAETAAAVRQFHDPAAADRLRTLRADRDRREAAQAASAAALAGLAAVAVLRRAARPPAVTG